MLGAFVLTLIAVGFVLERSDFMTSEEVIAQSTPGVAPIYGFFKALSNEDAAEAQALIDPDFTILQLPNPLGSESSFVVNLSSWSEPIQTAEDISRHLSVLAALQPQASVTDCQSDIPGNRWSLELYDRLVTCKLVWNDELREALDARPVTFTIVVGVHDELIRGFFATNQGTDPEEPTEDVVRGEFLPWLSQHHPAVSAELFAVSAWGEPLGFRDPAGVGELFIRSEEFAVWMDNLETTGTEPSPSAPAGRTGHALVYQRSAGRVLLIGGNAGLTPREDVWSLDIPAGTWRPLETIDLDPTGAMVAAANHPSTDHILAIAGNFSTSEMTIWSLRSGSTTWTSLAPPPQISDWCSEPSGLVPEPDSRNFLVVCNGAWTFDPEETTWRTASGWGDSFNDLYFSLLPGWGWYDPTDGPYAIAIALAPDLVFAAGAGQIRSLEISSGRQELLAEDGPSSVTAMTIDPNAGIMVIIGDEALWSFNLETNALQQIVAAPAVGMLWRTAAAAYDQSAEVMVIFDGERTWTFDTVTGELRSVA
jgi:hypothetical protein